MRAVIGAQRGRLALVAAGAAVLVWTLTLAAGTAGSSFELLGIRVSSRDPLRALITGVLLASIGLVGLRLSFPGRRWLAWCAAAATVIAVALGITYGTFVAGGADAYGYVSQADLWRQGSVLVRSPLASEATWPDAAWAITPLGYRPAQEPGLTAPVYPIGLPLTMAALEIVAGNQGAYLVVPILGGLLIWLTYLLGRAVHSDEAGLFAAVFLLASPAFLFHLMLPMSDVPVSAWWSGAVILALAPHSRWRLIAAGAVTALALLTRPNLVLLGLPLAALVIRGARSTRERLERVALWGAPASLAAIVIAILNARWYGSIFQSGYGSLHELYSPRFTGTNLVHFAGWLISTQTPFILLGVVQRSWLARWCMAFALCVLASYLWYLPFDNWTYVRFLLPAYPMLLATAAAGLIAVARRYRWPGGSVVAAGLILVCFGLWQGRLAFTVASGESRYRSAADFARLLPEDAVVISNLHSGSVRYYARRMTMRYEWIGEDEYGPALTTLRSHGHEVYALLDGDEVRDFRSKYERVADLSWLSRPMVVVDNRVFLFAIPP